MSLDFNKIKETAEGYKADMSKFLRDLIKAKGESTEEKEKFIGSKKKWRRLALIRFGLTIWAMC